MDIKPYSKNAKKHPDKQLKAIADSLREFGWQQPIVVDKDGVIIVGHGRWEAYNKYPEGIKEPRIEVADLTEQQAKAYRLADNKLNESDWDMGLAIDELKELTPEMFDLTGFDADLLIEPDDKDDEVPDVPEEPKAKLGDIYQLGEHRVMCGDSTKVEDVEKLMDGKKADMVFTDPPYGIDFQSNMRIKTDKFHKLENDNKILTGWIPLISIFSKGFVFVWTTWKIDTVWRKELELLGNLTNVIIWFKGGGGIGDLKKTFLTDYEMALVYNRGYEITGKRLGSVWKLDKDFAGNYKHPTQKPVELSSQAILNTTNQGGIILDLFLGSGSTLIACEKTNRTCYGMELDPKYIDVIIQRWEEYTGNKARKIN